MSTIEVLDRIMSSKSAAISLKVWWTLVYTVTYFVVSVVAVCIGISILFTLAVSAIEAWSWVVEAYNQIKGHPLVVLVVISTLLSCLSAAIRREWIDGNN